MPEASPGTPPSVETRDHQQLQKQNPNLHPLTRDAKADLILASSGAAGLVELVAVVLAPWDGDLGGERARSGVKLSFRPIIIKLTDRTLLQLF